MANPAQDFRFHPSHGAGIRLNVTRTTATRVSDEGSIVLSNAPIETGWIYEVKASNCRIEVGICDWNPDEEVPRSSLGDNIQGGIGDVGNGWRKAVVCAVESGLAFPHGVTGTACMFTPPDNLYSESKIGVMLDEDKRLHLYIDGQEKGVVPILLEKSEPEPKWYAYWDLRTSCQQATVQPVRQPQ